MRVATFNVLSGRSPGEGKADLERFGAAVQELDADLLGLQDWAAARGAARPSRWSFPSGRTTSSSYMP